MPSHTLSGLIKQFASLGYLKSINAYANRRIEVRDMLSGFIYQASHLFLKVMNAIDQCTTKTADEGYNADCTLQTGGEFET